MPGFSPPLYYTFSPHSLIAIALRDAAAAAFAVARFDFCFRCFLRCFAAATLSLMPASLFRLDAMLMLLLCLCLLLMLPLFFHATLR